MLVPPLILSICGLNLRILQDASPVTADMKNTNYNNYNNNNNNNNNKGKSKFVSVLFWALRHEGVLGSGGIVPCILDLGTRRS
jgi:hypothetical protein